MLLVIGFREHGEKEGDGRHQRRYEQIADPRSDDVLVIA
jgi:hypothetical protein